MSDADIEERDVVRFSPRLSFQRYKAVIYLIAEDDTLRKVVDFGCSTGKFFMHLKQLQQLTHYAAVDISYSCLESAYREAQPLAWDLMHRRDHTLTCQIFKGSIADRDPRLAGFDVVTCIELVEHLQPEDLEKMPGTIFGFIRPRLAVITTPNRDFNVVFPNFEGMRHWDHKFEWSRKEFQEWCAGIVERYPSYEVHYSGVGDAPSEKYEGVGHCTQIAIFRRRQPCGPDGEAAVESAPLKSAPEGEAPPESVCKCMAHPECTSASERKSPLESAPEAKAPLESVPQCEVPPKSTPGGGELLQSSPPGEERLESAPEQEKSLELAPECEAAQESAPQPEPYELVFETTHPGQSPFPVRYP